MKNCDSDEDGKHESLQTRLAKTPLRKKVLTFCSKIRKVTPSSTRQTLPPAKSSRFDIFSAVRRLCFGA